MRKEKSLFTKIDEAIKSPYGYVSVVMDRYIEKENVTFVDKILYSLMLPLRGVLYIPYIPSEILFHIRTLTNTYINSYDEYLFVLDSVNKKLLDMDIIPSVSDIPPAFNKDFINNKIENGLSSKDIFRGQMDNYFDCSNIPLNKQLDIYSDIIEMINSISKDLNKELKDYRKTNTHK